MAPEDRSVRFAGRAVLGVPGSRSALNRTIAFTTPSGVTIRIPDLASALSLKGAAYHLPGANRVRHLQDAITLFACANSVLELSTSMRKNVNHLINALDQTDAWAAADPPTRRRAVRAIRQIRPQWAIPSYVPTPATQRNPTRTGRQSSSDAQPGTRRPPHSRCRTRTTQPTHITPTHWSRTRTLSRAEHATAPSLTSATGSLLCQGVWDGCWFLRC